MVQGDGDLRVEKMGGGWWWWGTGVGTLGPFEVNTGYWGLVYRDAVREAQGFRGTSEGKCIAKNQKSKQGNAHKKRHCGTILRTLDAGSYGCTSLTKGYPALYPVTTRTSRRPLRLKDPSLMPGSQAIQSRAAFPSQLHGPETPGHQQSTGWSVTGQPESVDLSLPPIVHRSPENSPFTTADCLPSTKGLRNRLNRKRAAGARCFLSLASLQSKASLKGPLDCKHSKAQNFQNHPDRGGWGGVPSACPKGAGSSMCC